MKIDRAPVYTLTLTIQELSGLRALASVDEQRIQDHVIVDRKDYGGWVTPEDGQSQDVMAFLQAAWDGTHDYRDEIAAHVEQSVVPESVAAPVVGTLSDHLRALRQLVLEHPEAANMRVVIAPHGSRAKQELDTTHLNLAGTTVVIEAKG